MEFNEQKAIEIIEKYNLQPATLQVWKTRGSIPERYAKDFKPADNRTNSEILLDNKVMDILSNKKLNLKAIFNELQITFSKYSDAKRIENKNVPMQASDIVQIAMYLTNLGRKISFDISILAGKTEFTSEERSYIEDSLRQYPVNVLSVLECQASDKIYCRLLQRKNNPKGKFEDWEVLEILSKLYKLIKEIEL